MNPAATTAPIANTAKCSRVKGWNDAGMDTPSVELGRADCGMHGFADFSHRGLLIHENLAGDGLHIEVGYCHDFCTPFGRGGDMAEVQDAFSNP